jgi:hypothetical protein
MGKDASCAAVAGKLRGAVRAHLDGERLHISGAIRLNVPLAELRGLAVRDGALCFEAAGQPVRLELGERAAAAWARAIAQPKSLLEKLGLKGGQRVCVLGLDEAFRSDVARVAARAPSGTLRGAFDAIFVAIEDEAKLDRIARCKAHLVPSGALWVVSPKGKGSPVRESAVRAAILGAGLVETKVVSFSATHTAAKAVIPVAARGRPT